MNTYRGNGDTFAIGALTFRLSIERDEDVGAPWEENDGHGVVSDWRRYDQRDKGKAPGELLLASDRFHARFYDLRESLVIATRDKWGLNDEDRAALAKRYGREPTAREVIAQAVRNDYERLRRWCNDDWCYCGVTVTLLDVEGDETEMKASLWSIESDCERYIDETARELAREIADNIGPRAKTVREERTGRTTIYRVRP